MALVLALLLSPGSAAFGFPLLDSTFGGSGATSGGNATSSGDTAGSSDITGTRDLTSGESTDLLHQLQLVNGVSAPAGGGWTFIPRVEIDEELTDNVYQVNSPRRWDLITYLSPGFSLAADLPRLTLTMSYSPSLALYTHTGPLNALTQQLNALGTVTVVPELAFVDLRAMSGVSNLFGGVGNQGGFGAQAGSLASSSLTANGQGLNRQNETQFGSFGLSPYLRHQFGDLGQGKLGYALDVTRSNTLSGFASAPFPTGGLNSQTLVTNEEYANFTSGQMLQRLQDVVNIDLQQSQSTTEPGFVNGFTGAVASQSTHTYSTRNTFSNQVTYQLNHDLSVFVSGGWEDINYSGSFGQRISDATWRFGATATPNPDTTMTISYGHDDGFNSMAADARYALTGRTTLTLSYQSTLGTQLQYVQQQLNGATATSTGQIVNGTTGGQLFLNTNALAQQDTLFRTDSLIFGSTTSWDRDVLSLSVDLTRQTTTGSGSNGISTKGAMASVNWIHQMRPDMTLSGGLSLNKQGEANGGNGFLGNYVSYAASIAWQYQLTETVGVNVRYSFFDRISQDSSFNVYQSLLIAGITKTF
ncbi:MAG TPA: hypothetical protein VFG62_03620 [Rhodopila sp.]|nr:hypothetical protein [Rhodopila sp.]